MRVHCECGAEIEWLENEVSTVTINETTEMHTDGIPLVKQEASWSDGPMKSLVDAWLLHHFMVCEKRSPEFLQNLVPWKEKK